MNSPHDFATARAVHIVLKLFPASIREDLINKDSFRSQYGLTSDAYIAFEEAGLSVQRSKLFDGIREVLSDSHAKPVFKDEAEKEWRLGVVEEAGRRRILLSQEKRRLFLPVCSMALSQDLSDRLACFEQESEDVNFPEQSISIWREKLSSGPLTDDEFSLLEKELKETPIRVLDAISSDLESRTFSFSSCVPNSTSYYHQLVGMYQEGLNLEEYVQTAAKEHIQKLMSWRPYDGFLYALLLSSHSSTVSAINIEQLEERDLINAYKWLQENGDLFSKLGAVEIGLSVLDKRPKIEPYLKGIIEQIRDDNPDGEQSRFGLLSALIIVVDGELSRTKLLRGKSPFWRRLASISQASLVERCTIGLHGDNAKFSKWALDARGQPFYMQNMTDLRLEPRWVPEYISSRQLKAEFICRIINSAERNDSKIKSSNIRELLFGEGDKSLRVLIEFPYSYLPGPLEGGVDSQNIVPDELVQSIKEQLSELVLQPSSFTVLMNSALIYRLDSEQAKLAVKALRAAKHQLRNVGNKELLFSILSGLATVAAVTRSVELADELVILARRSRACDTTGNKLSAEESLWIGLTVAAVHSDLDDWCHFLGEWITELAFLPLHRNEMERLHSHVEQLCHIVPELWHTCGRAEAALQCIKN